MRSQTACSAGSYDLASWLPTPSLVASLLVGYPRGLPACLCRGTMSEQSNALEKVPMTKRPTHAAPAECAGDTTDRRCQMIHRGSDKEGWLQVVYLAAACARDVPSGRKVSWHRSLRTHLAAHGREESMPRLESAADHHAMPFSVRSQYSKHRMRPRRRCAKCLGAHTDSLTPALSLSLLIIQMINIILIPLIILSNPNNIRY